jgi:hypothetical protein
MLIIFLKFSGCLMEVDTTLKVLCKGIAGGVGANRRD